MDPLSVDTEQAYNTSHAVANDAEELRDELTRLEQNWEKLASGWTGVAASAYTSMWTEWLEGATALVDSLAEASHQLGVAAVRYSERDTGSAAALDSTTVELGL